MKLRPGTQQQRCTKGEKNRTHGLHELNARRSTRAPDAVQARNSHRHGTHRDTSSYRWIRDGFAGRFGPRLSTVAAAVMLGRWSCSSHGSRTGQSADSLRAVFK
jgi:hypothetical protein